MSRERGKSTILQTEHGRVLYIKQNESSRILAARGIVPYGQFIETIDKIPDKRKERLRQIVTYGSDQICQMLIDGGLLTLKGRLLSSDLNDFELEEDLSKKLINDGVISISGKEAEEKTNLRKRNLFVIPQEKVVVISNGLSDRIGYEIYKSGSSNIYIDSPENDYKPAHLLNKVVTNRFRHVLNQSGIYPGELIGPRSLRQQLLVFISDYYGKQSSNERSLMSI